MRNTGPHDAGNIPGKLPLYGSAHIIVPENRKNGNTYQSSNIFTPRIIVCNRKSIEGKYVVFLSLSYCPVSLHI